MGKWQSRSTVKGWLSISRLLSSIMGLLVLELVSMTAHSAREAYSRQQRALAVLQAVTETSEIMEAMVE